MTKRRERRAGNNADYGDLPAKRDTRMSITNKTNSPNIKFLSRAKVVRWLTQSATTGDLRRGCS
jgi:hypothetical protein